jgi:uncharacterized protein involved in oxidation of intracellular sulfur
MEAALKALFILNGPPYGDERCYNALRLASSLIKNDSSAQLTVFLMADATLCAKRGQKTPDGFYNLERMLKRFANGNHRVLLCSACMDARGLTDADLIDGAQRSSMDELAKITLTAERVLTF